MMLGDSVLLPTVILGLSAVFAAVSAEARIIGQGRTIILGTYTWDIETDTLGHHPGVDIWWEQANDIDQYLYPMNGTGLTVIKERVFEEVTPEELEVARFETKKIPNTFLQVGAIIGVRTAEGNVAKLKIVGYRELHDFSFPEARHMNQEVRAFFLSVPNTKKYHLEVEWVVYRR